MGLSIDIYDFGAMMYEVISGGSLPFGPFEKFIKDMASYEQKKKGEQWDHSTLRASTYNSKWVNLISKCIRFNPDERYSTIDEVLSDLGYRPVSTGKVTSVHPNSEWTLRVQNGEEIGREYHLTNLRKSLSSHRLTIGWFNENEPFTNHIGIAEHFTEYISNYHATLEYSAEDYHWYIKDGQWRSKNGIDGWYNSTNGVLVQGKPVDQAGIKLTPGNIIAIGGKTLKVVIKQS
jgi:serine/threonine protein kinase